jgi:hypothetical protein
LIGVIHTRVSFPEVKWAIAAMIAVIVLIAGDLECSG